ncbi:hypothetical protein BH11MYX4_BH11MYX4_51880 [soil metagenome]
MTPPEAASPAPTWQPPPRDGCLRSGSIEAIEGDPSCVVARADESLTREAMKQLTVELKPDVPATVGGATVLVRLTITNRSASEAELVFTAQPASATARPDWTRLAGVPELRPIAADAYRISMPVRTVDPHERSVDGLSTTPRGAAAARLLRVRLKPGAKLTHTFPWWALRIPAPMPIFHDDAGHRIVPKTAPLPLPPGEYGIAVDLPLLGVSPAESIAATRILVEKIEKPDGAAR